MPSPPVASPDPPSPVRLLRGERSTLDIQGTFQNGLAPKGDNTNLLECLKSNTAGSNYISTTPKEDVALGFATNNFARKAGVILEIYSSRGIDVNATYGDEAPYPEQNEFSVPGGVRPEEIKGAWIVKNYQITDEYIANPNYNGP